MRFSNCALVLILGVLPGCGGLGCQAPSGCAKDMSLLRADIQRGVCVAHNYQNHGKSGYGTAASAHTLKELSALGVGWISLTPFGFTPNLTSTEVRHIGDYAEGETDERIVREVREARLHGLRVLLKPQLWVSGGQWRGELSPKDGMGWDAWFTSYSAWILRYADLAEKNNIEILAVGVELKSSALAHEARWRELITEVRAHYSGSIVYCANWDAVSRIAWWDAVDYIGVQFYGSLSDEPGPTEVEMQARLKEHLDQVERLATRVERPVLFTEVGYRSAKGATIRPHEWPERDKRSSVDLGEQARAYRVFMTAINQRPWVKGLYWWKWFTDPETDEEGPAGFSPRAKPAEAVLRAAYSARCGT